MIIAGINLIETNVYAYFREKRYASIRITFTKTGYVLNSLLLLKLLINCFIRIQCIGLK